MGWFCRAFLAVGMGGVGGLLTVGLTPAWGAEFRVPDPDAGISTIADALSRTQPGDVVFISEGVYNESLRVTTVSLSLIGLGGVRIQGPDSPTSGTVRVPALQADGAEDLRLEHLEIRGGLDNPAVAASDSTLYLTDVWVEGGAGKSSPYGGDPAGHGLVLIRSCCAATSGVLIGGRGGNGGSENPLERHPGAGGDGGHGVLLDSSSRIQLTGSSATGGNGGNANWGYVYLPLPGGDGGDGVQADHDSEVALTDTLLAGGGGGYSFMTDPPEQGVPLRLLNNSTARDIASLQQQAAFFLFPDFLGFLPPGDLDLNADNQFDVADLIKRLAWCRP